MRLKQILFGTCAALVGATAFQADAQTLSQKWENSSITTGNRDIAYNPATGNLLVAQTSGNIIRINTADGTVLETNLDNTDISQGTFLLAGVTALKNGTIFACNYVTGAQSTTPLKVYRWENEAAVPELVTSLGTLPGGTGDRFGQNMKAFVTATTTNLLVSGNGTNSYLVVYSGTDWTFKRLISDTQVMTPSGTFIDYNAPGFENKFRVVAKSRGSHGQLYNFDPTTAGNINLAAAGNKTAISGEWIFKANGITSHDYDPKTGLLAGTTSTIQVAPFSYTNMIFNTTAGPAAPVELSRVTIEAAAADAGQAGGTAWGTDGRLYTLIPVSGAGLRAFDISAFLITGPASVTKVSGQSVTFSSVFGGSGLIYTWTKDGNPLSDDSKYSGTTTGTLIVNDLVGADAGTYIVSVTDANGGTADASATLIISPSKAWTGGGADFAWSTGDNWGGTALATSGETAVFAGTTKLVAVMDGPYDVTGLLFSSTAGEFVLTNAPGIGTLTLSGTLANESVNLQQVGVPVALHSDQTVDISGPVAITGELSGSGTLTKVGAGTLTLAGTNTHTGSVNISAGTLAVTSGNAVSDSSTVTLATGGTLSVDVPETIGTLAGSASTVLLNERLTIGGTGGTYTGGISGTNDIEIAVTGTQVHHMPTTYTGKTILTAGTLSANDATTFGNGTGALQFNGGTLFRASQSTAQTFANPISVTADSILAGNPVSGTRQVFFSTPTLTSTGGTLTITNTAASGAGIFQVRLTATAANSSVPIVLGQGDFGLVELVLTNNATGNQIISGPISGTGSVVKNATVAARQTTISGNNSFSGGFSMLGGRVNLNNNNAAGTGVITVGTRPTIELASTVAGTVINNDISLMSGASPIIYAGSGSQSLDLAGVISGDGRLVRTNTGTGTIALSGDNTFSGGVTVYSRTLTLKHRNALGTGTLTIGDPNELAISTAVTIASGADLTGPNAIANAIVVNTNFTISAGASNPIEIASDLQQGIFGKGLTKTGAGVLTLSGFNNSYSGDTAVNAGTLNVNGALISSPVTVGANGTLSGNGNVFTPVTVNGRVSGGSLVGTLTTGDQTWNGGGRYKWDINDATGGQGSNPGTDLIAINGSLTINATSATKFNIDVTSLAGSVLGDAANFNGATPQNWTIVTTTGGITGFDPAAFNVTMTSFSNPTSGAVFAVRQNGNDLELYLIYPPQNVSMTGAGTATFTGAANTGYLVEFTDSLSPVNWQPLTTVGNSGVVTTDGAGVGSYADPGPLPASRFYRISLQ